MCFDNNSVLIKKQSLKQKYPSIKKKLVDRVMQQCNKE